jgi:hypothetical protein
MLFSRHAMNSSRCISLQPSLHLEEMRANITKQLAVVTLIVFHLASPYLVHLSHSHVLSGNFDSQQTIRSHDCGSKEIHRPLDDSDHCLLCLRASTTVAILESVSTLPKGCVLPFVDHPSTLPSMKTTHISEPDRGPPASSV